MNYIEEYNDLVQTLSSEYTRKYNMLERDDIAQELWVWFVGHPRKYKEWSELESKDKDKLIAKSLRNAALKYCEREKAKKSGYDSSDLYYYDVSVVEAFLPSIIAGTYSIPVSIQDLNAKFGSGNVSDGNNWLSLRSDISKAFEKLSDAKQNILRLRFSIDSPDWSLLAKDMESTPDGARMKVQRAMNSLIKNLGGWRPYNEPDTIESESQSESGDEHDSELSGMVDHS
jgi:DNA-directed RNA polymerase specialized sigma24 family protein